MENQNQFRGFTHTVLIADYLRRGGVGYLRTGDGRRGGGGPEGRP